jgi:hypothetical protein
MRAVHGATIIAPLPIICRKQVDELVEKAWRCLGPTVRAIGSRWTE